MKNILLKIVRNVNAFVNLMMAYIIIEILVFVGCCITDKIIDYYEGIRIYNNEVKLNVSNMVFSDEDNIEHAGIFIRLLELFPAEYKTILFSNSSNDICIHFTLDNTIASSDAIPFSAYAGWNSLYKDGDNISIGEYTYTIISTLNKDDEKDNERSIIIYWDFLSDLEKSYFNEFIWESIGTINEGIVTLYSDNVFDDELSELYKTFEKLGLHVSEVEIDPHRFRTMYYLLTVKLIRYIIILFSIFYCIISVYSWIKSKRKEFVVRKITGFNTKTILMTFIGNLLKAFLFSILLSFLFCGILIHFQGYYFSAHAGFYVYYINTIVGLILLSMITLITVLIKFDTINLADETFAN